MKKFEKLKEWMKRHKVISALVIVFVISVLCVGGMFLSIFSGASVEVVPEEEVDLNSENVSIAQKEIKNENVYNVLLVGTDSQDPDGDMGRSDSMMLVSYNTTDNKATIVSFLRDSLVDIPGHGKSRLGHAYAYGGVGLTINTLNKAYDLDIQNYITVSFEDLMGIIDKMGGIEVNITAEEAQYYRACGMSRIKEGYNMLSGAEALAYTRNRTLGTDFERTRRQRSVMYAIYAKLLQERDPEAILALVEYCMKKVETNMPVTEIYTLAMEVLSSEHLQTQQAAIPYEGTYENIDYEGMEVLEIDIEANKAKLEELMY